MILLALTPEPLPTDAFPDAVTRGLRVGPWTATAVVEGGAAEVRLEAGGLSVVETPVLAGGRAAGPLLLGLRVDTRRLVVERPPASARPVYYAPGPDGGWLFATRVSTLRRAGLDLEADPDVLPEVLVYRFVMPPRTLYRGVSVLPAGAGLELAVGEAPVVTPYAPPRTRLDASPEVLAAGAWERLDAAVARLEPCRDALVVLLSGGLDSSILYALCRDRFQTPDSYSISNTFGGEDDLEKPYALSAAEALGARHTWWGMDETAYRRGFLRAVAAAEEPLHHIQSVLIQEVVERARPHGGGVVVNGEGADSAFGQELQRLLHRAGRMPYRALGAAPLRALLRGAVALLGRDPTFVDFLGEVDRAALPFEDPRGLLWEVGAYGNRTWVVERLGVDPAAIVAGRQAAVAHVRDLPVLDLTTLLAMFGDAAVTQGIWGKLAESGGSRMVYPFCDRAVSDHAFSMPWAVKLAEPKRILRLAARQSGVPELVITRPKAGFGVHEKHWSRPGGAFDPFIPLATGEFDEAWLRGLQTGASADAMTFWSLLSYAVWKRLAIRREPLADLEAELRESEARA